MSNNQFKIGVNALVIKNGKVLMGKRLSKAGYGTWGYPGGHLDFGESLVTGVKRELEEETGLIAETVEFSSIHNQPRETNHYIQIQFVITSWHGEVENREPDACAGWEWFDLNELPTNIFLAHSQFMKAHLEKEVLVDGVLDGSRQEQNTKEHVFVPKPGQVDYTNIRWAPVVNCVVKYQDSILLVKRSATMRLYPGYWSTVMGFLDDHSSLEEKVETELKEELNISSDQIVSIELGQIFLREAPEYHKTWIVHPALIEVKTDEITLDWEAEEYVWLKPHEIDSYKLFPDLKRVLQAVKIIE